MKKILSYLRKKGVDSKPFRFLNPNWYKDAVGGMWDEIGKLQFEFLVREGLKPEHLLLDVGCGSLRGGVHFVRYLEPGRYFGIDMNKALLDAGWSVLRKNKLMHKKPTLVEMSDFNVSSLGRDFDYVLAQSVFTHLPLNSIIRCVMNIDKVLVRGGRFYATFFEIPEGKRNLGPVMHPRANGTELATYFDKDPYHYDFETFKWVCDGTNLRVERIGEWGHPKDQRMMVFIKL
jgi:SAM-dependent methyltransferase